MFLLVKQILGSFSASSLGSVCSRQLSLARISSSEFTALARPVEISSRTIYIKENKLLQTSAYANRYNIEQKSLQNKMEHWQGIALERGEFLKGYPAKEWRVTRPSYVHDCKRLVTSCVIGKTKGKFTSWNSRSTPMEG